MAKLRRNQRRNPRSYVPIQQSPGTTPPPNTDLLGIPTILPHDDQFATPLANVRTTIGNRTVYEVNYSVPNCYTYTEFHTPEGFNDTLWSIIPVAPDQGQPRFQIYHFNRNTQFFIRHLSAELSIVYTRKPDGLQTVKRHDHCHQPNWILSQSRILSLTLGI